MRRTLPLALLAACVPVGVTAIAAAQDGPPAGSNAEPARYLIPGEKVFPEGIAREPGSRAFYVTSTTDGTIFRGDLRSERLTMFAKPGERGRATAIGLKSDGRGNLVVAGGPTGKIFVLSTKDGATRKVLDTGKSGDGVFLNDVAISKGYAYVTDSQRPILHRVRLGRDSVGAVERFVSFAGTAFAYQPGFNANGIAINAGGTYAIVVQSGTGKLFRIDLRTRKVRQVDLGGKSVKMGDGLLLAGSTLYVARNAAERIVPIRLRDQGRAGTVGAGVTGPQLKFPTTLAKDGDRLLAVNAQFDKRTAMLAPELPFDVATIEAPRAPAAGGR